jgi:xanthine dehydrogenase accessory factor
MTSAPVCSPSSDDDHAALRFAAANEASLCTIVGIEGSFSRRVGAQIAVASDGTVAGSLADGCLERELASQCELARRENAPRLLRYGRGSPFIDFRLPCGSGLDIVADPNPDRAALIRVVEMLEARGPARLALPVKRPGLMRERHYLPELRLMLLGSGPEVTALAQLAAAFGLSPEVAAPGRELALGMPPALAADSWTAIILLSHDHEWERDVLGWALDSPALFIGALGGRVARENRCAWLEQLGFDEQAIARVRSPVGLIPHARDARVLALSVLAEVVAAYETFRPEYIQARGLDFNDGARPAT